MNKDIDAIIKGFDTDSDSGSDNEESDIRNGWMRPKLTLGLSKAEVVTIHQSKSVLFDLWYQEYEFKVAFKIISENKDSIPIGSVYDLFLSLGYTFQDKDIEQWALSFSIYLYWNNLQNVEEYSSRYTWKLHDR